MTTPFLNGWSGEKEQWEIFDQHKTTFCNWLNIVKLDKKQHQLDAIEWCLIRELFQNHSIETTPQYGKINGGILADDMGLGKTILMLGCIICNPMRRTLIVVPPVILDQWRKCIFDFLGHKVLIYHGTNKKNITFEFLNNARLVLTTYGMIATRSSKQNFKSELWDIKWDRVIYDEAHHMRTKTSHVFNGAKKVTSVIKWLVTGTPIQNHTNDLKSLLSLLGLNRYFTIYPEHEHDALKWYILKRSKKSVGIKIPGLESETIMVPITNPDEYTLMAQLHAKVKFSNVTVDNVDQIIRVFEGKGILPIMTACRQACIYPSLLTNKWENLLVEGLVDFNIPIINSHSKLTAVVNKIVERKNCGKKIVFCHYRDEIDKIANLLENEGMSAGKLDGRTNKKHKKCLLTSSRGWADMFIYNRFNSKIKSKSETFKMLIEPYLSNNILIIQIQNGCEGLNLQAYNEIYFVSPHWNPGVEDQAIARAHRIGQKKIVYVFRFVTQLYNHNSKLVEDAFQTLDEYCIQIQTQKRTLIKKLDDILHGDGN